MKNLHMLLFYFVILSFDSLCQVPFLVKNLNQSKSFTNRFIDVNGTLYFTKENDDLTTELWKSNSNPQGSATFIKTISYYENSDYQLVFASIGSTLYFNVLNYPGGGLWKTDGTIAGTEQVKELSTIQYLTVVNQTLYFGAIATLWKSDGTAVGTVQVKDISGSEITYPKNLTNLSGTLYFSADDGIHGRELWKSDGTDAGTMLIKDIRPGTLSGIGDFASFCGTTNKLFFLANNGSTGTDLWVSDGTVSNTTLVKDFWYVRDELSSQGNYVLFSGMENQIEGEELWKSDGTSLGTVKVKEIAPSSYSSSYPSNFTKAGNYTFFSVVNDSGSETSEALWRTDGTETGTIRIANINRSQIGTSFNKTQLGTNGTTLYFSNYDPVNGDEVHISTGFGSSLLKDIRLGIENSLPRNFTKVGSQIYFEAHTDDGLTKVFKSNGTSQGTSLALNMSIYRSDFGSVEEFGNLSENINMLDMGNGILFFTVRTDNGYELYKTSGSASSTILLKSFGPYVHSAPRRFKNINGIVFFAATDNTNGEELWKSDGTVAGTVLVKDINPGSSGSSPNKITSVGNTIYFIATHPYYGRELWKSDGTSAGTVLVKDIYPGTYSDDYTVPINMTDLNGTLYFTVSDNVHGRELWKSDGTAAGTVLVKDIRTGSSPSMFPSSYMINAGGTLYFQAYTEATGYELWKSDGTSEGTVLVKDINPGSKDGFWSYSFFTWMNGFLYFQAQSTDYDLELWKTDGTTNGTVLVKDIAIGRGSGPEKFVNNNGILYFTAYDEESEKQQLWKSDGTNAGTVRVKNIDISIDKSGPTYLTAAFGKIYFGIANSYYERIFRLWQSDGTEAGTFEVSNELKLRDLSHFAGNDGELDNNSYKKVLIPSGERLYFFADNGKFGMELWSLFQPPCSTNLTLINPTDNIFDGNNLKQASAINGKIQASNHITGTAIVTYQAKTIELNPNFKAENGTVFKAEIGGCN